MHDTLQVAKSFSLMIDRVTCRVYTVLYDSSISCVSRYPFYIHTHKTKILLMWFGVHSQDMCSTGI